MESQPESKPPQIITEMEKRKITEEGEKEQVNLILVGPPGSGKGTQSEILAKKSFLHISTGNLLHAEKEKNSPLGKYIAKYFSAANLIPLAFDMAKEKILEAKREKKNFVLEGSFNFKYNQSRNSSQFRRMQFVRTTTRRYKRKYWCCCRTSNWTARNSA